MSGPLMNFEGKIASVRSKTVKVILPSLGYMMLAEVEMDNVKMINDYSFGERELLEINKSN